MKKKRRLYQPHVFDGKIITSDEIERIQKFSNSNASKPSPTLCAG
jgi:hypothetical protein